MGLTGGEKLEIANTKDCFKAFFYKEKDNQGNTRKKQGPNIDRQVGRQVGRQIDRLDRQIDRQIERQIDRQSQIERRNMFLESSFRKRKIEIGGTELFPGAVL